MTVMQAPHFRVARRVLGLSSQQLADVLGYTSGAAIRQFESEGAGARPIPPRVEKLIVAYLSGYRPKDWPEILRGSKNSRS